MKRAENLFKELMMMIEEECQRIMVQQHDLDKCLDMQNGKQSLQVNFVVTSIGV
jgi:hypothetical protein